MKKSKFFNRALVVLCVIAAFYFVGHFSAQKKIPEQVLPPVIKFKVFQSKNPPFNFTFEYPDVWHARERGYQGSYDMVEVMGAPGKNSPLMPGIFVTKKALAGGGTLNGLMDAWLKTEGRYRNFKVFSSRDIEVSGQKALETEYGYVLSLPLMSSKAKSITVKKEQIVVVKDNASFELTFIGTEEQFKIYKPIFRHALETFEFSEP